MTRRDAFTCLAMFAFGLGLTWAVANMFAVAAEMKRNCENQYGCVR